MIQILYSLTFRKELKKLNRLQKARLEKAVSEIVQSPFSGEAKAHDLTGVYIDKVREHQNVILVAYEFLNDDTLRFLKFGVHENFYRDLKREN